MTTGPYFTLILPFCNLLQLKIKLVTSKKRSVQLLSFSFLPPLPQVFLEEFSSMRRWVSMHVSDHSGFHYRQFLLQALLTELCKAPDMSAAATPPHQQGTTTPSQSARLPDSRAAFGSDQSSKEWQPGIGTIAQLFDLEMEFCSELIHAYPGHETLWCHR